MSKNESIVSITDMFNKACSLRNERPEKEENNKRAVVLFEMTAEKGHVEAMYRLAYMLQEAALGVEKDLPQARSGMGD